MILAPLVGIVLNLLDASEDLECREHNDVAGIFASMDCPDRVHCGFQYLLGYNWVSSFDLLLCVCVCIKKFLLTLVCGCVGFCCVWEVRIKHSHLYEHEIVYISVIILWLSKLL